MGRDDLPRLYARLIELTGSKIERVALEALRMAFDRICGKPLAEVSIDLTTDQQTNILALTLSPSELDQLRAARQIIGRHVQASALPDAPHLSDDCVRRVQPTEADSQATEALERISDCLFLIRSEHENVATLNVYQHLALPYVEAEYQKAMRDAEV